LKKMFEKIIYFLQEDLIGFILDPELEGVFLLIKVLFILVSIVMVAGIFFLLVKNTWLKRLILEDFTETFATRPYGARQSFKEWLKTSKRLESGREDEYKLALIEADGLLDDVLRKMGYKGDNIADRLKQLDKTILPNLEQVQEAHNIRNNVVHDPDYKLNQELAKKSLGIYEKALQDLEVF